MKEAIPNSEAAESTVQVLTFERILTVWPGIDKCIKFDRLMKVFPNGVPLSVDSLDEIVESGVIHSVWEFALLLGAVQNHNEELHDECCIECATTSKQTVERFKNLLNRVIAKLNEPVA